MKVFAGEKEDPSTWRFFGIFDTSLITDFIYSFHGLFFGLKLFPGDPILGPPISGTPY